MPRRGVTVPDDITDTRDLPAAGVQAALDALLAHVQ